MSINLKSKQEIALMREAGRMVALTLLAVRQAIRAGVSTGELDAIAETTVLGLGGRPAFKGYRGFPASLCVSINEELVHGIPRPDRLLREGDIVSLDFGAIHQGYYGDAAMTVPVGLADRETQRLLKIGTVALARGIEQARSGNRLSDISSAIQTYVERHGFSVVRRYVGHGIGREMHERPEIPNFGPPGQGPVLRPGMTLAIEPMVNAGTADTVERPDGWTVVTADSQLSVHFEHTVAIGEDGPQILTLP